MPGVLYASGDVKGVEASGVYQGIIKEDMVTTIQRVKKPFIDVFIDKVFFEDVDYPLTYVPMFNMVLPLKKDQKVWVYFNQDNHRYPVLWKLDDDLDGNYTDKKFDLPSGFPSSEQTTEVLKISDKMWFLSTDSYGVLHWGDQCILLNNDKLLIGNGVGLLGGMVDEILDELIKLKTFGTPTSQSISVDQVTKLIDIQNRWGKVFGKKGV